LGAQLVNKINLKKVQKKKSSPSTKAWKICRVNSVLAEEIAERFPDECEIFLGLPTFIGEYRVKIDEDLEDDVIFFEDQQYAYTKETDIPELMDKIYAGD